MIKGKVILSAWKVQSWNWDFERDGSAIGTYGTGILIPKGCFIFPVLTLNSFVNHPVDFGEFRYQIGYAGQPSAILDQPSLNNLASFTAVGPILGLPRASIGTELLFTIVSIVSPGTFGSFTFNFCYIQPNT